MAFIVRIAVLSLMFTVLGCGSTPQPKEELSQTRKKFVIAWSHYTSWEAFNFLEKSEVLKAWEDKYNVDIEFKLINDYVESLTLYSSGSFDGILSTNMDALTTAGVSGIDSKAILVTSSSNGNDALVGKGVDSVKALKGQSVLLVQYSVSHYLLSRALTENGLSLTDIQLKNVNESDTDSVFTNTKAPAAVATWNPILIGIKKDPETKLLFDSSMIPGEIVEMLFVRPTVPPEVCRAITGAWFEAMGILGKPGSPDHDKLLADMAKSSGGSLEDFKMQLETTRMFYTPKDALAFLGDETFTQTMDKVRSFCFDAGLYGQGASSKELVGMKFPAGTILGDGNHVVLSFDTSYLAELNP